MEHTPRSSQPISPEDYVERPFRDHTSLEVYNSEDIKSLLQTGVGFEIDIGRFVHRDDLPTLSCGRTKNQGLTLVTTATKHISREEIDTTLKLLYGPKARLSEQDAMYAFAQDNRTTIMGTFRHSSEGPAFDIYGSAQPQITLSPEEEYGLILDTARVWSEFFGGRDKAHTRAIVSVSSDVHEQFRTETDRVSSGFNQVGGQFVAKERLAEAIAIVTADPEMRRFYQLKNKPLLLRGPHGSGKDFLAQSLAAELHTTPVEYNATALVGQPQQIDKVFDYIEGLPEDNTHVVILNQAERIFSQPKYEIPASEKASTKHLLDRIDSLAQRGNVLFVANYANASPTDQMIPSVSTGDRFDLIELGEPTSEELEDLYITLIAKDMGWDGFAADDGKDIEKLALYVESINPKQLAQASAGAQIADIVGILEDARRACFLENRKIDMPQPVTQAHINTAIQRYKRRVR